MVKCIPNRKYLYLTEVKNALLGDKKLTRENLENSEIVKSQF